MDGPTHTNPDADLGPPTPAVDPTTAGVWAMPYVWLYALQIYFDFSAYTDIARGCARILGRPESL